MRLCEIFIIILVGGGAEIAQNILMSISCKTDIPSPQITAAFPFVNILTKNVIHSAGSNLLAGLKWEIKGVAIKNLITICRARLSCVNNGKKLFCICCRLEMILNVTI